MAGVEGFEDDTDKPSADRKDRNRLDVKCYGGKAALSWENDENRKGDEFRISVQGCPAIGPQKYDWKKKIVLQLTEAECFKVLGVLIGEIPKFEATAHGAANDKTFSIELQPSGKFYAKVAQKNNGLYAVPIEPVDALKVAGLVCRQLCMNQPWLDANGMMNLVRSVLGAARKAQAVGQK